MNNPDSALNSSPAADGLSLNLGARPWGAGTARIETANHLEEVNDQGRILVVDDDAGVRYVLERVLHSAGYRVSCAEDGEMGWNALCAGPFDVVITDHDMPRLTGLDLLRRVRTTWANLPVIFVSGRMPWNESDFMKLLRPGLALEKPFSFIELLKNIHSVLTINSAPNGADSIPRKSERKRLATPVATWLEAYRACTPLSLLARAD